MTSLIVITVKIKDYCRQCEYMKKNPKKKNIFESMNGQKQTTL